MDEHLVMIDVDDKNGLILTVQDSGKGISRHHICRCRRVHNLHGAWPMRFSMPLGLLNSLTGVVMVGKGRSLPGVDISAGR